MHLLPILLLGAGFVICVYGNAITTRSDDENLCPPPENITPCKCFKDRTTGKVTAQCSGFRNAYDIKDIFDKNPDWKIEDVWIESCSMSFLPSEMLETAQFQTLHVSHCTLRSLFDKPLVKTPELNLILNDVKIAKTYNWKSISNVTLKELGVFDMTIKTFDRNFKQNVPEGVERMYFMNTETTSIKDKAFSHFEKLQILTLNGGSLKTVSRDMFPKPWIVNFLSLSQQKISNFPEDFFTDMPNLQFFEAKDNKLTTISEDVFAKQHAYYNLDGNLINCNCKLKWLTKDYKYAYFLGSCAEPSSLREKELKSLREENFGYCR